jgi:hypothetical protein
MDGHEDAISNLGNTEFESGNRERAIKHWIIECVPPSFHRHQYDIVVLTFLLDVILPRLVVVTVLIHHYDRRDTIFAVATSIVAEEQ